MDTTLHDGSAQLSLWGKPVFTAEFESVPSRNARKGRWGQAVVNNEWRLEACEKALAQRGLVYGEEFFAQVEPLIEETALVVCTVYLHNTGIADIHNPDIKPILDGLTDGGVYRDDEWAFVPLVLFAWGGIMKKKLLRIDVYELRAYIVEGLVQPLPAGRRRNE